MRVNEIGKPPSTLPTTQPHQPTPPQPHLTTKDLLTDTESLFWVFVDAAASQLRAQAHPKKSTNTLIRPFTPMHTWTNGDVEEKEVGANDCSFKFVFTSTDETVFLLEEGKKPEALTIQKLISPTRKPAATKFYNHDVPPTGGTKMKAKKEGVTFIPNKKEAPLFDKVLKAMAPNVNFVSLLQLSLRKPSEAFASSKVFASLYTPSQIVANNGI